MADRYWVGGTASWDGTAGTKWAATSGGAGGASVPTTADDVFFDASSTGTVTIATGNTGAKSINCTGFTGTITGTAAITIAGGVTLVAAMTWTHSGVKTFTGTGTLITAGKLFRDAVIDGSGIAVTLGDALNLGNSTLTVTLGTFDTANYNLTAVSLLSNNNTVRTITLGSSTVTISNTVFFQNSTNLTLNANTSQINFTNASFNFDGGSQTFYNVSFTSTSSGTRTINGANTFNDFTLTAPSSSGIATLAAGANQTVNGTLSCAGASALRRCFVRSSLIGTARTITAAVISADDCDFRDIVISGAASPIAPTRAGDCGGNTNITFPAAKTVYRVGTSDTWAGSNSWALTSGGAGTNDNFPLPQDTAVIDENAIPSSGLVNTGTYNCGTLDCSNRTTALGFRYSSSATWHGSHIWSSALTISGNNAQTFAGRGMVDFTSAGQTMTSAIVVDAPSGTFRLGDAYSANNTITHTRGTFDANNYNVTCTTFKSSDSNTRAITMGSGLWTLSGTGIVWDIITPTNLTLNTNTANILLSSTSSSARTFRSGTFSIQPPSYNKLTIGGTTGTSTLTISVANGSFTEVASTKTVAHTVRLGSNLGTVGAWSIAGTAGNVVTLNSETAGSRRTFTLTNITSGIDYLSVKDIGELSGNKFYVGANSTDGGNNSNVYFTDPPSTVATGNMLMLF